MKKKTLLIAMVLTMVMSTSVFAAGGDNYGEDIFGTTSSQVTTTKASATEKATDKENIKNKTKKKFIKNLFFAFDTLLMQGELMCRQLFRINIRITPAYAGK